MNNSKKYPFLALVVASLVTVFIITLISSRFSDNVNRSMLASYIILGAPLLAIFFSVAGLIQFRVLQNKGVQMGGLWIYMTVLGLVVAVVMLFVIQLLRCGFSGC